VNYNNVAFGGGGFGPGHKVIAGYDFADGTADPMATSLQHGTSVAGLIASNSPSDLGIAPGAEIVALKVFGGNNQADFNTVGDALQWVIDNHSRYNITDVNISIADGNNYSANWFVNDGGVGQRLTSLIGQLDAMNIPVVTATGNSYNGQQGESFPAIVSDTISVTATNASDQLVSNAQHLDTPISGSTSVTTIAAPGDNVEAPADGNNLDLGAGTSFAAPIVSGAVVLMQQVYQSRFGHLPTVDQLKSWLTAGSDPISGSTIGRLDIPKAISLIPNVAQQTLTPPVSTPAATTPPVTSPTPPAAPPVVSTPPPATSTTPALTTSPTTQPSSPPAQAPTWGPTSQVQLYLNGQAVSSNDLASPSTSSRLSGVPAFLVTALKSFSQWWTGTSQVQVWSGGNAETAGVLKGKVAQAVARQTPTVKAKLLIDTQTTHHKPTVMPRAWHAFAGARGRR
jgi:type VI secretion system secreted protein VgrG